MSKKTHETIEKEWQKWHLHQMVTPKMVSLLLLVFIALGFSAHNTEMDTAAIKTGDPEPGYGRVDTEEED